MEYPSLCSRLAFIQSYISVTRPAMPHVPSVQDMLKNNVVTTIVSGTPAMFTSRVMTTTTRLSIGQIVMTQAGKTVTVSSTVQVGNRQLTQQQVLKQHTILKQNQSSRDLPFPPMLVGLPPPAS